MVGDRIADMLTRIRNANQMRYETVEVLGSKMTLGIAEILKREGYIVDYNGLEGQYHEYNSVHLSGASYDMTFAREFKDYLKRSINEILQTEKNYGQKSSI